MATVAYALTTKEKVKAHLGIASATTTYDSLIETFINQVTDFIEGYCGGRRFKETTYTAEMYDSDRQFKIFLKNFPVTTLTSVEYRSGTIASPSWVTYTNEGYLLYSGEGYVHFFGRLPKIHLGIRFTYVAGYKIDFTNELTSTHTLPFDLTMAATMLCAKIYNRRQSEGISQMSTEGQSISFAGVSGEMDQTVKEILDKYKTYRLAI